MNPERWQEIRELLHSAMQVPLTARPMFLELSCSDDPLLRKEVDSLLRAQEHMSADFLETVPIADVGMQEGTRVGPYQILNSIGTGGMGEVYRASDTRLGRIVALKVLPPQFSMSPQTRKRFQREAQAISALQHPNICTLYDVGQQGRTDYLVMELMAGSPIDQYCDEHRLTIRERLHLFLAICSAVQYAHQHLIVHCDIKPSNILMTSDGVPKLLDFGIAKILEPTPDDANPLQTVTVQRALTPGYASPEQLEGKSITTTSDVYSLGVLLYELLTGRSPYLVNCRNPQELARAICDLEPEKPSVAVMRRKASEGRNCGHTASSAEVAVQQTSSEKIAKTLRGDLDNIVMTALRKEPQRRYASVEQLAQDIQRHLDNLPIAARKDTFRYRSSKFVFRHKFGVAATAVIALTFVMALILTLRANHEARLQADIAQRHRTRAERRFNDVRALANTLIFDLPGAIHQLPGSVVVEKMLYDNGLKYLDSIAAETEGDRSLQRELASAYKALGDSQGFPYGDSLGDSSAALVSYRKSLQMRENLLRSDPYNIHDQIDVAKLHRTIGALLHRRGESQQGREQVRMAFDLIRPVAQAHHDNVDVLRELGNVLLTIGNGYDGLPAQGLKYHSDALGVFQNLAERQPDVELWQQQVGYMNELLSADYLQSGRPNEAMRCAKEELQIFTRLEKHADNSTKPQLEEQKAIGHSRIGVVLLFTGHPREAATEFHSELDVFQKFYDPKDRGARGNLADSYINLGHAESQAGNFREALNSLQRGKDLIATLMVRDASVDTWSILASVSILIFEGETLEAVGEEIQAFQSYKKAITILESPGLKDKHAFDSFMATAYVKLAGAHARLSHTAKSRDAYHKALQLIENPGSDLNPIESRYSLISIYAGLGDLSPVRSCEWYHKSLAVWNQLPIRNSISPNGFQVVEFSKVSTKLESCK
jgi:serine/threonine protein kinase